MEKSKTYLQVNGLIKSHRQHLVLLGQVNGTRSLPRQGTPKGKDVARCVADFYMGAVDVPATHSHNTLSSPKTHFDMTTNNHPLQPCHIPEKGKGERNEGAGEHRVKNW